MSVKPIALAKHMLVLIKSSFFQKTSSEKNSHRLRVPRQVRWLVEWFLNYASSFPLLCLGRNLDARCRTIVSTMAARQGFEPRQKEPESFVLPLHYRAKQRYFSENVRKSQSSFGTIDGR